MTAAAVIIRAAIPTADPELCEHILWGRTPYPVGPVSPKALYKAASGFIRAHRRGVELCDWCERPAKERGCCEFCNVTLVRMRDSRG